MSVTIPTNDEEYELWLLNSQKSRLPSFVTGI